MPVLGLEPFLRFNVLFDGVLHMAFSGSEIAGNGVIIWGLCVLVEQLGVRQFFTVCPELGLELLLARHPKKKRKKKIEQTQEFRVDERCEKIVLME